MDRLDKIEKILEDLAILQSRNEAKSEKEYKELRDLQSRNEAKSEKEYKELRDLQSRNEAKSEKEFRELRELQSKGEKEFKELRELQSRNEAKSEKDFEKLKEIIKDTRQEIGGISHSLGNTLEYSFFTSLRNKLDLDNVKYDKIYTKLKNKNNEKEFDIVLENGKTIALIEIKTTPREKHFENLTRIKEDYIKNFSEDKDKEIKVYLGSLNFANNIIELSEENNIQLLTLKNDLVKVVRSKNHKYK